MRNVLAADVLLLILLFGCAIGVIRWIPRGAAFKELALSTRIKMCVSAAILIVVFVVTVLDMVLRICGLLPVNE